MKIMWFKYGYDYLYNGSFITVDPMKRVQDGVKLTTLRTKQKNPGVFQPRSGNYRHFNESKEWPFKMEMVGSYKVRLSALSDAEIIADLGLIPSELEQLNMPPQRMLSDLMVKLIGKVPRFMFINYIRPVNPSNTWLANLKQHLKEVPPERNLNKSLWGI